MKQPILELHNVTKKIGKKTLVDHATFQVQPGEVFGFLGPNGAGKTTTIRMIVGHMSITEGEIKIKGHSIQKEFEKAISHVGGIVENPEMYKFLTGYQNLIHFARMTKTLSGKQVKQRIDEVVKILGLENRIHDKVKRYSLGMRQRLGLAQALLHRPSLLILDEPTNGLDPAGIRELRDYLRKLAHEEGLAVLVSSHLLSEMELMCDRIGIIQQGKVIDVRSMKEMIEESENQILFRVKQPKDVCNILQQHYDRSMIQVTKDGIILEISQDEIPTTNQLLVQHRVPVYGIEVHSKSLEEKFLEVTEKQIV